MSTLKSLYTADNLTLFSDGTIGMDDGIGYLGTMGTDEVKELYLALKTYFEEIEHEDLL